MKRLIWLILGMSLLWGGLATAQENDDEFFFTAERDLSAEAVRAAAQPLINRGAQVAVYWTNSGDADDFVARLAADGLGEGELVDNNLIALYVSMDPRYSEIRWGDDWDSLLAANGAADNVRLNILNINLREKQYELAFVETLLVLDEALAGNSAVVPIAPSSPNYTYQTEEKGDLGGWLTTFFLCMLFPFIIFMNLIRATDFGDDDDESGIRSPLYKSRYTSSRRSTRSSRSSISRGSSRRGSGGRSGGSW